MTQDNNTKYDTPVKFSVVNTYGSHPRNEDDVYTVKGFKEIVAVGGFKDYDGFGHAVKDSLADVRKNIKPSRLHEIPDDATHIVWYNR